MTLTSRRRRPLDRGREHLRDTRLVIIATEGRETEPRYFSMFRSTRIQLKLLPTGEDNRSSPEDVLGRLRECRREYELGDGDALWLMVDVDRWGSKKLAAVASQCRSIGFGLAVSNPCFETWLLLHLCERVPEVSSCSHVEDALRAILGGSYSKANPATALYAERVQLAAQRAEATDPSPRGRWPGGPGTHVYRVVRSLPDDMEIVP